MKTHRIKKAGWVTCAVCASALVPGVQAANPPQVKVIEAQRRMDLTGQGSYHRIGLLRELANTQRNVVKKQKAGPSAQNARVVKS